MTARKTGSVRDQVEQNENGRVCEAAYPGGGCGLRFLKAGFAAVAARPRGTPLDGWTPNFLAIKFAAD